MTDIYVQYTDASGTAILAVFTSAQDDTVYPNQGVIESSDERYVAYYDALTSIVQMGMIAPGD